MTHLKRSAVTTSSRGNVHPTAHNNYDADLARMADDGNPLHEEPVWRRVEVRDVPRIDKSFDFRSAAMLLMFLAPPAVVGAVAFVLIGGV